MKRDELAGLTTCAICRRKIGQAHPLGLFWRVRAARFGLDLNAIRRQDALGAHMGSDALADVMGPNEDLAIELHPETTFSVCDGCAMNNGMLGAAFETAESANA